MHIATYRHGPYLIRAPLVGRDAPQVAHLSFDPKGLIMLHRAAELMERAGHAVLVLGLAWLELSRRLVGHLKE